ncbi:MAG: ABC transporter ATP-binding protein [Acutalibacteraceae bacterium]|nr:ABC transporter ATP-binding protein [Acutalibacteraceae bacterium]
MKTLIKYLKPYYFRMLCGLIIKVTGTVVELFIPYILSHILENVIKNRSVADIIYWGLLMLICAAVACICNIIANRMAASMSRDYAQQIRHRLFVKTLHLSAKQTDIFTIASLESRITNDTYNIHHFVGMMQRMGVRAPIMLIGGVTITMFMDSYLSMVMLISMPVLFLCVYLVSRNGIPLYAKVQSAVDSMVRVVREDTQGIRVIKALSKDKYEHTRYDKVNKALVKKEKTAGIVMGSVHPIMNLFMNMGIVAVIALSVSRVTDGLSSPETVIAFMQYFTQISMSMMVMSRMFTMASKCMASANRIEEVLLCEDTLVECDKSAYPDKINGNFIEFSQVSFSYNGKKNDLTDISFSIKNGESLGIIGATGSGKSTIVKLLLRFYDVDNGNIYINGENIRTIDREKLYGYFGTVMQNDFLYNGTIMENIRFGRDISDNDIYNSAKIAQADGFIRQFNDGYNRILSQKGTNVSGGQKQRILIARALAQNPAILVLDDSSSALDYKTEAALRNALRENLKSTVTVNVAQRVSAVKDCDLIIVLDEGKIIGMGTHSQLLENCKEYREINDSQMGGAFVE